MLEMWLFAQHLVGRARCRARAALRGEPESGALSLEWIAIASLLVIAAGVAYVIFRHAIQAEAHKLP